MKFITYGGYVWLPVLATLSWLATLLGLLLLWLLRDHHEKYGPKNGYVVFISDVGAAHLALFIPGCTLVFIFYTLTLIAEWWLRRSHRIPRVRRKRERFWGVAALVTGILGGFSLMMLAALNDREYPVVHWTFTLLFILLVGASSVAQTIEVLYLQKGNPNRPHLKRNAFIKSFIVAIAIGAAIIFGCLYGTCKGKATSDRCDMIISAAGVCEWLVSFLLLFYFMTYVLDLWPAAKTSPRHQRRSDWNLAKRLEKSEEVDAEGKEKEKLERLEQNRSADATMRGSHEEHACSEDAAKIEPGHVTRPECTAVEVSDT